jgi:hypothetical protein
MKTKQDEVTIIHNLIFELFSFYNREIMLFNNTNHFRLGSYFQEYMDGLVTDYQPIKYYIETLNNIIFYFKNGEVNTRNQDMGYINSLVLEKEFVRNSIVPFITKRLSQLGEKEFVLERIVEILNTCFFNDPQFKLFAYTPLDIKELPHIREADLLEAADIEYYLEHKVIEQKKLRGKTRRNNNSMVLEDDHIIRKLYDVYIRNIIILVNYIRKERKNAKTALAKQTNVVFPEDLYRNITEFMGVPRLSKTPTRSETPEILVKTRKRKTISSKDKCKTKSTRRACSSDK